MARIKHSGELTLQPINRGEDEIAVGATSNGNSTPTTVEVEPGTYRTWCTLSGHAAKGMDAIVEGKKAD